MHFHNKRSKKAKLAFSIILENPHFSKFRNPSCNFILHMVFQEVIYTIIYTLSTSFFVYFANFCYKEHSMFIHQKSRLSTLKVSLFNFH